MERRREEPTGITWAAAVPLVGGMMFGARRALGGEPRWIASYEETFGTNDALAKSYFDDALYFELSDEDVRLPHVDVVVSLCPCAGLSHATTGAFGSDSRMRQNMWMVRVADKALGRARPKVLVGENAPNLFTSSGRVVRDMLFEVADAYGYNMSFVKTSTDLHGIPQSRVRSFYFFWRKDLCDLDKTPFLSVVRRPSPTLDAPAFLEKYGDPEDAEEDVSDAPLKTYALYRHVTALYGEHWRRRGDPSEGVFNGSLFDMTVDSKSGGLEEYVRRAERGDYDGAQWAPGVLRLCKRAIVKFAEGKGVMAGAPACTTQNNTRFRSLMWKTFHQTVHPKYERFLTYREFRLLMDVPEDFPDYGRGHPGRANVFCQNVPTAAAMDAVVNARLFVEGRLDRWSDSGPTWLRDASRELYSGVDTTPEREVVPQEFVCEMDGCGLTEVYTVILKNGQLTHTKEGSG